MIASRHRRGAKGSRGGANLAAIKCSSQVDSGRRKAPDNDLNKDIGDFGIRDTLSVNKGRYTNYFRSRLEWEFAIARSLARDVIPPVSKISDLDPKKERISRDRALELALFIYEGADFKMTEVTIKLTKKYDNVTLKK